MKKFNKEMFGDLLELAPDAMLVTGPDGKILLANFQAEKLLGYSMQELLGHPIEIIVPDRFKQPHVSHRKNFAQKPHTRPMGAGMGLYAKHKDGHEIPVEISLAPTKTDQGVLVTAAVRDVTLQRQAEKILMSSKAELEESVQKRTAEIRKLQKEILEISELEQRRIGQDLHDGAGQTLTAVTYIAQLLHKKLLEKRIPEAKSASEIVQHVSDAIEQVRRLARGLYPVELTRHGLAQALKELAFATESQNRISCKVKKDGRLDLPHEKSIQLYRIAQEAVNNAVKHGSPKNISILIAQTGKKITLTIEDDGTGIDQKPHKGMGLDIMKYRAQIIGGSLDFKPRPQGGTQVSCVIEP